MSGPKVETQLRLEEGKNSCHVMLDVAVDGIKCSSVVVLGFAGGDFDGGSTWRKDLVKRFMAGEVTLPEAAKGLGMRVG